jgi:hypothetical protein
MEGMTEAIYDTLWELFLDVQAHSKQNLCEIISTDSPGKLLLGWGCPVTNFYFQVRLTDVRMRKVFYLPDGPHSEKLGNLLPELIRTTSGRKQIVTLLNIGFTTPNEMRRAYDRICSLKAFW